MGRAGMRARPSTTPAWATNCLVEVDPNVVLCTYTNDQREELPVAQLIRFTEHRIELVTAHE